MVSETNNVTGAGANEDSHRLNSVRINWPLDEDGIPHRQAARVILLDSEGNTYLIRGHDFGDAEHWWWFTVGGGLENQETSRQGAARELWEETGLTVDPDDLVGPVLYRQAEFQFCQVFARQDEYFFLYRVPSVRPQLEAADLTELEKDVLDETRWFTATQLREIQDRGEVIYPLGLVDYLESWRRGWDGKCLEIEEGTVGKPKTYE